jgi:hypothetical protein
MGSKEDSQNLVIKTVEGHKFSVPEDRVIEKKHGVLIMMPIDEYVAMKFSKLEDRLSDIEDSIKALGDEVTLLKKEIETLKTAPRLQEPENKKE